MVFNHPLSQQVKMDKIAKNMIPNAYSARKTQMHSVMFARKNTTLFLYFDTLMLPRMALTFTKTVA
jgi:hypothetical protein